MDEYEKKLRRREQVRQAEMDRRMKSRREIEREIDINKPNPKIERQQKTAFEDFFKTYQKLKNLEIKN